MTEQALQITISILCILAVAILAIGLLIERNRLDKRDVYSLFAGMIFASFITLIAWVV